MEEVDVAVLKQAVASVRDTMRTSMPHNFYDAGTIVGVYFIAWEGVHGKPKKRPSVNVNDIHRELERLFATGELSTEKSWLDPEAVKQREERAKAIDDRYRDSDA